METAVVKRRAGASIKRTPKRSIWKEMRLNQDKYLMMLPYMLLFLIFTIIPIITAIVLGFTSFNMLQPPRFIGWLNYIRLFLDDNVFIIAVKNTLVFALLTGPLSYFICLIFAWLINEFPRRIRSVLTFILYIPSVSASLFIIWTYIFSGDAYGVANGVLMNLGVINEPILWLQDPRYSLKIIILVQLWASMGTSFLAFIAGLQSIDPQLYEAASIDGIRNRFQELIYVTLPSMGPQLMFGAVMQIAASFAVSNICITLAGLPSTDYAAHTIVTHIIDYGTIRYEMGYASAIATVLFIVMLSINALTKSILKKYLN